MLASGSDFSEPDTHSPEYQPMNRTLRRYHRWIAIAVCLPLLLTVLSGLLATLSGEWLHNGQVTGLLMRVHTGKIFHLQKIYPLLNGLGLIGLIVTGLTMTGLLGRRKAKDLTPSA